MTINDDADPHEKLARQLDWNLLRTYIAIVQYKSISNAAEHLHLTQPAVSQGLKRLESRLGCRLIERSARRFQVTDAGHSLYNKALNVHTQISRLGDIATTERDEVNGHLRLLMASGIKSPVLDKILQDFHQTYPRVSLRIDVLPSIEIQGLMQQGLASAGFCLIREQPKNIEIELLISEYFGLYCGPKHRLFGLSSLSKESLKHENFISFPSDQIGGVLSPLTIYREQNFYDGRLIGVSYNLGELVRLTELGIGIGILPTHEAASLVKSNRLWRLLKEDEIGPIDVHMIWNTATEKKKAEQVFLEFAQMRLRKMVPQQWLK